MVRDRLRVGDALPGCLLRFTPFDCHVGGNRTLEADERGLFGTLVAAAVAERHADAFAARRGVGREIERSERNLAGRACLRSELVAHDLGAHHLSVQNHSRSRTSRDADLAATTRAYLDRVAVVADTGSHDVRTESDQRFAADLQEASRR